MSQVDGETELRRTGCVAATDIVLIAEAMLSTTSLTAGETWGQARSEGMSFNLARNVLGGTDGQPTAGPPRLLR
jgi:hypothetical protein